jgi:dolichyl-diphosphooligosaccharide--protein glycosyltransferase
LYKLSTFASGSFPLFAVGFAGFLLFLLKRWRELVLLFPPFLIGLISFVGGNRFVMYLAPFIGVGFGYLLDRAVNLFSKRAVFLSLGAVVAFLLIVFSNLSSFRFVAQPKITPALAAEFSRLPTCTLSGSWVWTWWDYGTAILYYARRGVYHDPQSFGTPKTYFVARSFVEDSPERAYNAILGVSNLGAEGIKELLEKGLSAKEVVNLVLSGRYSKPLGRPIYWLFSQDELLKYPAISYIGSWFKDGREKGRFFTFLPRICSKVSRGYSCGGWFLDPNKGVLVVPSNGKGFREIPLKRVVILKRDGQPLKEVLYDRSASLSFEVVSLGRNLSYGILLDEEAFKSMFNQMFVLRRYDRRLFTLVKNDFPVLVLYKVKD